MENKNTKEYFEIPTMFMRTAIGVFCGATLFSYERSELEDKKYPCGARLNGANNDVVSNSKTSQRRQM